MHLQLFTDTVNNFASCTKKILETGTGIEHNVSITLVSKRDLKGLTKTRYFFNWNEIAKMATLY